MRVGVATIFQNPEFVEPDRLVYDQELQLADLIEPLGFDSAWAIEHHFTDYTMCPDPLQFLTWMAARTTRIKLGSAVVVLPWRDPLRVAEQVSVLDHMSDGRVILGIGRGLGRVEFDGFRVPMDESRARFVESAQALLTGLESGVVEFDGVHVKQPRVEIRPAPFRTFRGRTYAAAVSSESFQIMADLGVGILIIPQKPWETHAAETEAYRQAYREKNQTEPPAPVVLAFVYCDEDEDRARELARLHVGNYWRSVMKHYELSSDHLAKTKGYEYYGTMQGMIEGGATDAITEMFIDLQVWGTPEQCYEKIRAIRDRVRNDTVVATFKFGGLPFELAKKSMQLFARTVRPRIEELTETPTLQLVAGGRS